MFAGRRISNRGHVVTRLHGITTETEIMGDSAGYPPKEPKIMGDSVGYPPKEPKKFV